MIACLGPDFNLHFLNYIYISPIAYGYHRVPWSLVCGNSKQSDTEIEVMHALIHDTFRASLHKKKIGRSLDWCVKLHFGLSSWLQVLFSENMAWARLGIYYKGEIRALRFQRRAFFLDCLLGLGAVTLCVQTKDAPNGFQSFLLAMAFSSLWGAIAHGFLPTSCYSIPLLLSKHAGPGYVWFRGRCLFLARSWVEQVTLPNSSHEGGEGKRDNNTSCKHSWRRD